jgi:hypothetical protein
MNFKATAGLLGCLFLFAQGVCVAGGAPDEESNPYAVISERNVFHLNPPPPPAPAEEPPKVEVPTMKLSGFLRIGQTTHALFTCNPKDKKDGPMYFNLTDGQKEGILEVVKIHEDRGEVDIINSGTPLTLSLKNDSLEPTAPPPAKGPQSGPEEHRGHKPPDGVPHDPARSAYRTPVPGEGGKPAFTMPMRRSRLQE